ncbi:hypothetical protein K439DRAFT_1318835, partial [Ramaria rubella]
VMRHIRSVIANTDTPSWLRSVPRGFGDAAAGTMKADEWRTMYSIYLPLALVDLWGEGSSHPSPEFSMKFSRVSDHTMTLVSAIIIACKRTMTEACATAYRDCLIKWVGDLTDIHPHTGHRPNHHMAFHIYDFLLLFGPVWSWWCFAFERLIGQLRRLPSNHKIGES